MPPPEKQDAQVVDIQRNVPVLFLESLPLARRGWSANLRFCNLPCIPDPNKNRRNKQISSSGFKFMGPGLPAAISSIQALGQVATERGVLLR
jgi:hypothetical protein